MKVILIYNPHNINEVKNLERVKTELASHITEIKVFNIDEIKAKYPIRETPAIIFIRDDLQGKHLFDENTNGELRIVAEMHKVLQEEEKNIFNKTTYRIDYLITQETNKQVDEITLSLLTDLGL